MTKKKVTGVPDQGTPGKRGEDASSNDKRQRQIPKELRDRPQWVGYRLEERDGKVTKVPCSAKTGALASSTDPGTWATFDEATRAAKSRKWSGIGYVFSQDDPYTGIDLDHVRDPQSGDLDPVAAEIVARLSSYTEVSQSGLGLHVIAQAKLPGTRHRTKLAGARGDDAGIEMYDSARYFVMTGDHLSGSIEDRQTEVDAIYAAVFPDRSQQNDTPPTGRVGNGLTDDEVLSRIFRSKQGEHIRRLWDGDTSSYGGDHSAADLALCSYLKYWTNGNAEQTDRLIRQSKLMRDKWDSPRGDSTYGADTIAKAIAGSKDGYNPNGSDSTDQQSSNAAPWPEPLGEAAYHGITGDLIRLIEPHSETDPAALVFQFLVAFGNAVGAGPYYPVERTQHRTNLYVALVGETAKSRKGTSLDQVRYVMRWSDEEWNDKCVVSGLSTGEGLIWAVRDPIIKQEPIKEKGKIVGYQDVQIDSGIPDKRLLVIQSEFALVLNVMIRDGNTLSSTLRQAWDSGDLRVMTKNSPARSTGSLISLIAHITSAELKRKITETDLANGFANRFLWVCAARSKFLPDGGTLDDAEFQPIRNRVAEALTWAQSRGVVELARDIEARALWYEVYERLSTGRSGLLGAITSRSEAMVLRLSMLYALLDRSTVIRPEHLSAALELWRYAEDSAKYIWGESLGYPDADLALTTIQQEPGIIRARLFSLFGGNNRSAARLDAALSHLVSRGLVYRTVDKVEGQSGRPPERWWPKETRLFPFLSPSEGMKHGEEEEKHGGDDQKEGRGMERNSEGGERNGEEYEFTNELTDSISQPVERKGNKPPPADQTGARPDCPKCSYRKPCATHEPAY